MDNDFNTPEAVAVLFDLANEVNRKRSTCSRVSCTRSAGCSVC